MVPGGHRRTSSSFARVSLPRPAPALLERDERAGVDDAVGGQAALTDVELSPSCGGGRAGPGHPRIDRSALPRRMRLLRWSLDQRRTLPRCGWGGRPSDAAILDVTVASATTQVRTASHSRFEATPARRHGQAHRYGSAHFSSSSTDRLMQVMPVRTACLCASVAVTSHRFGIGAHPTVASLRLLLYISPHAVHEPARVAEEPNPMSNSDLPGRTPGRSLHPRSRAVDHHGRRGRQGDLPRVPAPVDVRPRRRRTAARPRASGPASSSRKPAAAVPSHCASFVRWQSSNGYTGARRAPGTTRSRRNRPAICPLAAAYRGDGGRSGRIAVPGIARAPDDGYIIRRCRACPGLHPFVATSDHSPRGAMAAPSQLRLMAGLRDRPSSSAAPPRKRRPRSRRSRDDPTAPSGIERPAHLRPSDGPGRRGAGPPAAAGR